MLYYDETFFGKNLKKNKLNFKRRAKLEKLNDNLDVILNLKLFYLKDNS